MLSLGMTAAVLTFLILLFRLLIEELAIKKKSWSNSNIKYILSYFIQGITVIVVAVPEGLPLAVTLALAFAVQVKDKFPINSADLRSLRSSYNRK